MRRILQLVVLIAMPMVSHAVEEPEYAVIRKFDHVELRHYPPYVVAEDALKVALQAAGVATQGEPVFARYNAPFTPWFMRRNEIWLAVR